VSFDEPVAVDVSLPNSADLCDSGAVAATTDSLVASFVAVAIDKPAAASARFRKAFVAAQVASDDRRVAADIPSAVVDGEGEQMSGSNSNNS
jgi:hypothetical protein